MKTTLALKKKAKKDYGMFLNIDGICEQRKDSSKEDLIAEVETLKLKTTNAMTKWKEEFQRKKEEWTLILAAAVYSDSITREQAVESFKESCFNYRMTSPPDYYFENLFLMRAINDLFRLGIEISKK